MKYFSLAILIILGIGFLYFFTILILFFIDLSRRKQLHKRKKNVVLSTPRPYVLAYNMESNQIPSQEINMRIQLVEELQSWGKKS